MCEPLVIRVPGSSVGHLPRPGGPGTICPRPQVHQALALALRAGEVTLVPASEVSSCCRWCVRAARRFVRHLDRATVAMGRRERPSPPPEHSELIEAVTAELEGDQARAEAAMASVEDPALALEAAVGAVVQLVSTVAALCDETPLAMWEQAALEVGRG